MFSPATIATSQSKVCVNLAKSANTHIRYNLDYLSELYVKLLTVDAWLKKQKLCKYKVSLLGNCTVVKTKKVTEFCAKKKAFWVVLLFKKTSMIVIFLFFTADWYNHLH